MIRETGKANSAYSLLLSMRCRSLGFEPQQDWISAHYWLASLYKSSGDRAKARGWLGKLLEMWKQADPDLPLLKKVNRLAAEVGRAPSS
jgi:hypothetical protein